VAALVQTSTSNVCVSAGLVHAAMDETSPLVGPHDSPNHYGWTKVQAEAAVLGAHGTELSPAGRGKLQTVAVRPCSAIFGLQDNFMTEKWLEAGKVQLMLPEPKIDYVYNENVVYAHLLAEKGLLAERGAPAAKQRVGGRAFCITNEEPLMAGEFYNSLDHFYLQQTGRTFKQEYLPCNLMFGLASAVELIQMATRGRLKGEIALLTPAMFAIASLSHSFTSTQARDVLGYEPLYTVHEALQRTVYLWQQQRQQDAAARK